MKEYKRENLKITEFDQEDVITTSGEVKPTTKLLEWENRYATFSSFEQLPGNWF